MKYLFNLMILISVLVILSNLEVNAQSKDLNYTDSVFGFAGLIFFAVLRSKYKEIEEFLTKYQ